MDAQDWSTKVPLDVYTQLILPRLAFSDTLSLERTCKFFYIFLSKTKKVRTDRWLLEDIIGIQDEDRINSILSKLDKLILTQYVAENVDDEELGDISPEPEMQKVNSIREGIEA